jgi:hypothetical protein
MGTGLAGSGGLAVAVAVLLAFLSVSGRLLVVSEPSADCQEHARLQSHHVLYN